MSPHVLISGASIAGPALAHWLTRYGFEVTVVERAPALRPGGQAVDVRGIGKEVLRRMGLDAAVRAACTETTGADYVTRKGRRILSMESDMFDGDGPIAEIEILRGDISEVLYDATKATADYVFGDRVTALVQDAGGVDVTFESRSRRRFDLVIGADGLNSGIRSLAFAPEEVTRSHLGHYMSFFTVPNKLNLDRRMVLYGEPGRGAAIRSIHDNDAAMGLLSFRSGPIEHDSRDVAAQKAIMRSRIEGMAWEASWLLEQMDAAPDFYFDACSQIEMNSWSTGRVALLGDAGYCPSPLSGQGTALALIGAYLLAGELSAHPGDHTAAFAGYEGRFRSFVEASQKMGRSNAKMTEPDSRAAMWLQFAMMFAMVHMPGSAYVMRRMMKGLSDLELPDYPLPKPV
ncbi:MAG TPA: FAD-dependent monooxygenase [Pseudonocardia sp.]|nr:FAD-dependent monooxygenase [Pseudonocardia sp.]